MWIDCEKERPLPDNTIYEVLCSDGNIRKAYACEIGGWMVDTTQDFIEGKTGKYLDLEVIKWRKT